MIVRDEMIKKSNQMVVLVFDIDNDIIIEFNNNAILKALDK